MKTFEVQLLLYTLIKKLMEIFLNMLNVIGIIKFYKVMGWFDGQDIRVEPKRQGSIPFTNIYYVQYVYSYIYLVHVCKCMILKWVMDK